MSLILAAAGTKSTASALHSAGVDRIIAYHSSVYRKLGLPSVAGLLPWGSANAQTLEMLPDVLAGASSTPVIATVCANDGVTPRAEMLSAVRAAGVVGVMNAPTVGLIDGTFRAVLEKQGLGRRTEIDLIEEAAGMGLEAWAYVFDPGWVELALDAGAHGLLLHLGITGFPSSFDLEGCLRVAADRGASRVLLHGGDLTTAARAADALALLPRSLRATVHGYMGASIFEAADDITSTVHAWRDTLTRLP